MKRKKSVRTKRMKIKIKIFIIFPSSSHFLNLSYYSHHHFCRQPKRHDCNAIIYTSTKKEIVDRLYKKNSLPSSQLFISFQRVFFYFLFLIFCDLDFTILFFLLSSYHFITTSVTPLIVVSQLS